MVIVLSIIIIFVNIYLLAYYCATDDNDFKGAIFLKITAVLGMFIGLAQVCLLPLDVSNTRGDGGDFRMDLIWQIIYLVIAVFVFAIIPLEIAIYESDPDWTCKQKLSNTFCFFICEVIVVGLLFLITFFLFNKVHIPVESFDCPIENLISSEDTIVENVNANKICTTNEDSHIEFTVDFKVYAIALLSFISYLLFMLFGGVGIFAFPLDLIYSFCTRPIRIKPAKLEEMKKEIVVTAADLKDLGMQLKKLEELGHHKKNIFSKDRRHYNDLLKQLKVGVSVVDDQFQIINFQEMANQTSALGYLMQLIAGIFCMILTLLWILQIVFYIIIRFDDKPLFTFLNVPLVALADANLSFLSIVIYIVMTFYLLIVTVKGNFKFGLRIMILGAIHPMKKDKTYMNSILFNVMLVMLTSVSVIQFSIRAFGEYTSLTDADIIFNTQIKYLTFYRFFFNYNIFEYGMLIIAVISFVYLICRPNDTNTVKKILFKKFENDKKFNEESKNTQIEMSNIK
jgi:LMBR1 domain-containing protein 1